MEKPKIQNLREKRLLVKIIVDKTEPTDENIIATYKIDMKKVSDNEIGTVLNTKELVC